TVGMNAHDWSNITVYAYNVTSSTLSSGVESKVQIPNNPISIIDVPSSFIVDVGDTITIDANRTDADGDSPTFSSDDLNIFDIDPSSGVASWTTKNKDIGTHYVNLTVSDGYGSVDHQVVMITVTNVNSAPVLGEIGSQSVFEGQELAFTLNGTDPDNDPLTYSMSGEPAGATLDPSTGDFSWTPDYDDEGIHSIEFMVSDDSNANDTENVLITVNNMNREPVLDAVGPQSVNESETLTFTLNATDLDNETLTYSMIGSLSGATLDPSTGVFSWTPGYDASGIHYVDFIVTDPVNGNDLENVTITVNNVNRAPELTSIGAQSVSEGQELSFTLVGSDDDTDDTLIYSMSNLPSDATLNETTGEFSWIPDYDTTNATAGFDDVTAMFTVSDGEDTASQYVIITVTNTNRAPEFPAFGTVNAYEGTELVLNISATDPDEDTLSYFTNATFGTMNGTNFEWTPDYTQSRTYFVEFTVEDASLDDKIVVTIVVNDVNRAPVLDYIPTVSVNETEEVTITLSANDPDGDYPLYFSMDSNLGDLNDNVFTWTPDYIYQNTTTYINFTVSDGSLSDTKMAVIGVNDTNNAPVFEYVEEKTINENEYLSFTVTAIDPDIDDELTYYVSGAPSTAIISSNSAGINFSWTPSYDESGTYNVEFIVEDGMDYSDKMIVPIVVSNVNRAPVFDSLQSGYTINENEYLAITLGANDPDSEDEDHITVWINNTGNASGTLNGDIYSWDTNYRDSGIYNMEFIVSDGTVNTSGTTTITINDVNAPPVLSSIGSKSVEEEDELTFTITASDVDGDNLNYSALNLPDNATLGNTTGVFTWTPVDGDAGTYSVIFSVTDGVDTDSQTVAITVTSTSSTSSTTSSSSGGGGGGGGAATSGEEFDNIDFKDYNLKSVVREVDTSFSFYKENNSIVSLSFISELNAGQVKAVVEVLKDTSSQVDSAAPGDVYKNMNIYIDSNLADDVIDDCKINFKVDKVWVDENNIDVSMITLCRYNSGEWDILPTAVTGEDEYYYYFTSTTPGFSSYAISSVDPSTMTQEVSAEEIVATSVDIEPMMSTEDETPLESGAELPQKESSSFPFLIVIGLIGIMAMGFVGYRNRDYYEKVKTQLGNPDGKRYRRMKK
ncbi:Ig-like domain-containing protein, partial [Methanolobus profundi]